MYLDINEVTGDPFISGGQCVSPAPLVDAADCDGLREHPHREELLAHPPFVTSCLKKLLCQQRLSTSGTGCLQSLRPVLGDTEMMLQALGPQPDLAARH